MMNLYVFVRFDQALFGQKLLDSVKIPFGLSVPFANCLKTILF